MSHTIMTMETIDDQNSRWMVGSECVMVGLPVASCPTGMTPSNANYNYFTPPSYDGTWGATAGVSLAGLRTFLIYDFSPSGGADWGAYWNLGDPNNGGWTSADQIAATDKTHDYGPSSAHPAIVVVGLADGSTQSLSKQTDVANLFFLITKNNGDPFYMP